MKPSLKTRLATMLWLVAIGVPVLGSGCERQADPPIEPRSSAREPVQANLTAPSQKGAPSPSTTAETNTPETP